MVVGQFETQEDFGSDLRNVLLEQSNHKKRLIILAERNNGLLKVSPAADTLYN